ncbi:helicase [Cellvibrio sp. KY-GH-1]|nr:helicase [Cellvibrio sp. KY-GH-1]
MPSSMAVSFKLDFNNLSKFEVCISGAVYQPFDVFCGGKKSPPPRWKRIPVQITVDLLVNWKSSLKVWNLLSCDSSGVLSANGLELSIRAIDRHDVHGEKIVTIALINESQAGDYTDRNRKSFFQTHFSVEATDEVGRPMILPYREADSINDDNETLSNRLIYRNDQTFAVGHGCAADWNLAPSNDAQRCSKVWSEVLPSYQVPSITPNITFGGVELAVSMRDLAELEMTSSCLGLQQLKAVVEQYRSWIVTQEIKVSSLDVPDNLKQQGIINLDDCKQACARMQMGLDFLESNEMALKAFKIANEAMLLQQLHAPKAIRNIKFNEEGIPCFSEKYKDNDAHGKWRAFQIGFILMALLSVADKDDPFHEAVELIWFPTGGGKTEAYLGLAAFSLVYERLMHGTNAQGTQVLMRYTLRLLTAQQLQRASTLICALEFLREKKEIPGERFSIGLWVGGANTPNSRKDALKAFDSLQKGDDTRNPFLLDRCPWCSAQMGVVRHQSTKSKSSKSAKNEILGLYKEKGTVIYRCVDGECLFFDAGLPILVIDEDIYNEKPSIVIGTVDKFAMLTWNDNIRHIFGIGENGKRELNPPSLIIQDELHLISGPLGTMVGLYEPLIEDLCTDKRNNQIIKPKIIAATATTRQYRLQIQRLYGRSEALLFPPPAIDAEDSFFAKYERDELGNFKPGRKYVGVNAPGLSSQLTAQVRTFSALLSSVNKLRPHDQDPWRTLLVFYNSIRELGGGITLLQGDIPERIGSIKRRSEDWLMQRWIKSDEELTSRLKSEEIPEAIAKLQEKLQTIEFSDIENTLNVLMPKIQNIEIINNFKNLDTRISKKILTLDVCAFLENLYVHCKKENIKNLGLEKIHRQLNGDGVIDVCLASSIIEVGVDIDRLGMMAIVGQPKTTAQYIQVSGRVGRNVNRSPGLVVTLYSTAKPRDRSHFEHFRSYHQRLYAQVEPSSVTPFSLPAMERGLRAVAVAYARQYSSIGAEPTNVDASIFEQCREMIIATRGQYFQDDIQRNHFNRIFESMKNHWKKNKSNYQDWGKIGSYPPNPVLYSFGDSVPKSHRDHAWPAPTSMRSVDGEAGLRIECDPYAKGEAL